ncbi:MAG TPA: CoA transferase [Gammaproteobacteria bacterium]|nr:CoA transferase [Gammaproteobacteria bacterium]
MSSSESLSAHDAPLAGITVLDLTLALAGPFATFLLAGLGARVIKIENPSSPDHCRENSPFIGQHGVSLGRTSASDVSVAALNRLRGKYAVTLNLKEPGSQAVFADLVRQADVVVENFAPGTLDRLGVGYEFGRKHNPRIVYCSISGYGADQPANGSGKAMDSIIQALSGLMMTSGAPADPPVRVGVPFADLVTPVFGVLGVLAALRRRDATGVGQQVDVSMLGVLTSLVAAEPFDLLEACGLPQRTGLMVPRLTPFGVYTSADGYLAICAPTEQFARGVFAAIGRPELEHDSRFATRDARVANMHAMNAHIEYFTRNLPTDRLVSLFESHGVPAAPVRSPADAVRDARVRARSETVELEHPRLGRVADVIGPGVPIRFSGAAAAELRPAPEVGQDNALVYGEWLGYGAAELERLRAAGNI